MFCGRSQRLVVLAGAGSVSAGATCCVRASNAHWSAGLGRKVDVGGVRLTLFPGPLPRPGFTLDASPSTKIRARASSRWLTSTSLGASVRFLSLFQRKLEFSSLNLSDATINLVKTDAGPWNFQFLLENSPANSKRIPSIRMRSGRVNFKFGDTKSVFYFNDADLDVTPSSDGSMELRFGGAPSRTDRSTQEFGRFFVRGTAAPESRRLDLKVELERSPLEETLRWMDPRGFDVHGTVALDAQLSGPPSHLDVAGQIQLADVHRWDLIPNEVGGAEAGVRRHARSSRRAPGPADHGGPERFSGGDPVSFVGFPEESALGRRRGPAAGAAGDHARRLPPHGRDAAGESRRRKARYRDR